MKCNADPIIVEVNTASQNTTSGTIGVGPSERTLKMASDGHDRGLVCNLWQWIYFSNNVLIKNCIVD